MLKFIHLSDLHFHSKSEHNTDILTLLTYIQEEYPTHYLIVTGDIVDDGYEEQYRRALEALRPFLGRVFICPGNHDFGEKGTLYDPKRAKRFDAWLTGPLKQGGTFAGDNRPVLHLLKDGDDRVLLIGLDTNLETMSPMNFACGQVGEKQLTALNNLLSDPDIADTIVIVFFHHHPFLHSDRLLKLLDARELMRILYGRVHLVLFGHHHISKMWQNTLGIPYILACDNSPGKQFAREITISQRILDVHDILIEDEWDRVG